MRSLSSHLNNTKENLVLQYLTCYVPICILINDEFITIIYIIPIIRIRFNNVPTAYFPKQHPSTIKKRFSDVYLIHRTHTHTHTRQTIANPSLATQLFFILTYLALACDLFESRPAAMSSTSKHRKLYARVTLCDGSRESRRKIDSYRGDSRVYIYIEVRALTSQWDVDRRKSCGCMYRCIEMKLWR